jgi:hypothetical protein
MRCETHNLQRKLERTFDPVTPFKLSEFRHAEYLYYGQSPYSLAVTKTGRAS